MLSALLLLPNLALQVQCDGKEFIDFVCRKHPDRQIGDRAFCEDSFWPEPYALKVAVTETAIDQVVREIGTPRETIAAIGIGRIQFYVAPRLVFGIVGDDFIQQLQILVAGQYSLVLPSATLGYECPCATEDSDLDLAGI